MGLPPQRIDVTTHIDGVDFDEAIASHVEREVDGLDVPFLALRELVLSKLAADRAKDRGIWT